MARSTSNALWFTAGLSVGAALGLLAAPRSGPENRRYLADHAGGFLDSTRELYAKGCELADEAAELFEDGRKVAGG